MKRLAALLVAFMVGLPSFAFAQGLVTTTPFQATSVTSPNTVGANGTFFTAIAASPTRRGCLVQNTSANTIFLVVGSTTGITTPQALQIPTKTTFSCAFGVVVITDQISVSGVVGDTYVIVRQ